MKGADINDLPEVTFSSARLFADDCLLFRRIRKIQDAVDLQNDLSSLEKWERKWQMYFHPEKMHCNQSSWQTSVPPDVMHIAQIHS